MIGYPYEPGHRKYRELADARKKKTDHPYNDGGPEGSWINEYAEKCQGDVDE